MALASGEDTDRLPCLALRRLSRPQGLLVRLLGRVLDRVLSDQLLLLRT
jgi:hypothetical protein